MTYEIVAIKINKIEQRSEADTRGAVGGGGWGVGGGVGSGGGVQPTCTPVFLSK